jgi:hypothetical protein
VQSHRHLLALDTPLKLWVLKFQVAYNIYLGSLWYTLNLTPFRHRGKACWLMRSDFNEVREARICLSIASETQNHRGLNAVLSMVKKFECIDLRNKLYGVISLVDWKEIPVPTTDYSKDINQVAIDAFSFVAKYQVHEAFSLVYQVIAERILRTFEFTLVEPSFRRAIEMRSGRFEDSMLPTSNRLGISPNVAEPHWMGMMIRDNYDQEDAFDEDGMRVEYVWREQKNNLTILRDHSQLSTSAFAPKDTRAGDWFIERYGARHSGLILRKSEGGRFTLIGPTLTTVDETALTTIWRNHTAGSTEFTVFWEPEGLLVFAWKGDQLELNGITDGQISEFADMRLCAFQDSSYSTLDLKTMSESPTR